jgi:hypothetical protein
MNLYETGDIVQIIDDDDPYFKCLFVIHSMDTDKCWVYICLEDEVHWMQFEYSKFVKVGKSVGRLVIRPNTM